MTEVNHNEQHLHEVDASPSSNTTLMPTARGYQQEMLDASLRRNVVIAMDTGSGKTLIAVLRMKIEAEREPTKVGHFFQLNYC